MKAENYFKIHGWMISSLTLSGNELLIYAAIYGPERLGMVLWLAEILMREIGGEQTDCFNDIKISD